MADVKFSELPAGDAVGVADLLAAVQSSTSKKITAEQVRAFIGGGLQNRLINGEFRIWQRGISLAGQADDSYGAMGDRWYILTQTSTIAGARQADPFDGATHSGQLTQSQASAQRIGAAQIIEGKNCKDLRGQAVTFYGRFKCSVDQDIRFAILENTGTEDTVTSDVVDDWTDTSYAAGDFFIAGVTVTAVKEYASPGTGWVDFFVTGTVSTSCDNLIVFAWTEGTLAQNGTLSLANCGLVRGSAAPAVHVPRPFTQELALCQRYYVKTFPVDTTPAQVAGRTDSAEFPQVFGASTLGDFYHWRFPVLMRATPTIVLYNPVSANAQIRNITTAADWSNTTAEVFGGGCMKIYGTSPGGSAAGNTCAIHVTAAIEL